MKRCGRKATPLLSFVDVTSFYQEQPTIVKKITTGFVIQNYDTDTERFVSQEFVAGDQVDW